ncbi:uncharacterized protein BP5553_07714 [Venustampulla echinocandica]|uniref:Altered inheritance of mitochondria protein 9, mitochondrial n=1 Tax=Venustampulla echinocandica TaxID=2656787 RepID=A0A370THB2_9HELO|nr:uncharacterized protein BP5553_07714 [Venustampulla echinocandica]RDL34586.1 hypothetical protein BP5553_07714 [Venustampulla echinocandica]
MTKSFMSSPASSSKGKPPGGPDPYVYTSGRWLHRDQLQRTSRSIHFDFTALCAKVVELCPGAHEIASYDKKEGGFNRVFLFTMDNGARVAARLSFRVTGPARLTTHSEVATMANSQLVPVITAFLDANEFLVRKNTNIPVLEVLEWNDDKTNAVGAEYIIMEHAPGVQLHGLWPGMNPEQHMLTIKALAELIQSQFKFPLGDGDFCIGPHCGWEYWDCAAGEARYYDQRKPNSGPWLDLSQYCSALLDTGFSRIPSAEVAPKDELVYRGSVQEHLRLLKINEKVIPELIKSQLI